MCIHCFLFYIHTHMPYRFTFKVDHETVFAGLLHSKRCTATCNNGVQCRRHVVIGLPFCYSHLRYQKKLVIKPSTIQGGGKGLFACDLKSPDGVVFKVGDKLGQYYGERLNLEQLHARYGADNTPPYALQVTKNLFIDPGLERGFLSICNSKTSAAQCNARFMSPNNNYEVSIAATKTIRHGDEIFVFYGPHTKQILASDSTTVMVRK